MIEFPSPPADEDERDEAATRITSVTLATMLEVGQASGWPVSELLISMLSTVVDGMALDAGIPATRETLKAVVTMLMAKTDQ